MKKLVLVSTLVGFALFSLVLWKLGIGNVLDTFKHANFFYLIPFIIFSIAIFLGIQCRLKKILHVQGFKISLLKLVPIGFSGFGIGYITPSAMVGGEPTKAYLLAKQGMKHSKALACVVIDKMLELSVNGFLAFIGLIVILMKFALPKEAGMVLVFAMVILLSLLGVLYYRLAKGIGFFSKLFKILRINKIKHKKIYEIEKTIIDMETHIMKFFRRNAKTLAMMIILSIFLWVCMFFEYKVALLMFGFKASFETIFFVVTAVGIAYIFPVPAALGILEFGQAFLFTVIGLPVSIGVAFSLLIRSRDLTWTFIGLTNLFLHGFRRR